MLSTTGILLAACLAGANADTTAASSAGRTVQPPKTKRMLSIESNWASPPESLVAPGESALDLSHGTNLVALYRMGQHYEDRPVLRRFSLGLGLAAARWSRSAWSIGVPLDLRFDVLEGRFRPWLGFRTQYDWLHATVDGKVSRQLRFGTLYRGGLDLAVTSAVSLTVSGGYRLVDGVLGRGGPTSLHWFEAGAGVVWRFEG